MMSACHAAVHRALLAIGLLNNNTMLCQSVLIGHLLLFTVRALFISINSFSVYDCFQWLSNLYMPMVAVLLVSIFVRVQHFSVWV